MNLYPSYPSATTTNTPSYLPMELIHRILRIRRQLSFKRYIHKLQLLPFAQVPNTWAHFNGHRFRRHYYDFEYVDRQNKFKLKWVYSLHTSNHIRNRYHFFKFSSIAINPLVPQYEEIISPHQPHISKLEKPFKIKP